MSVEGEKVGSEGGWEVRKEGGIKRESDTVTNAICVCIKHVIEA